MTDPYNSADEVPEWLRVPEGIKRDATAWVCYTFKIHRELERRAQRRFSQLTDAGYDPRNKAYVGRRMLWRLALDFAPHPSHNATRKT